MKIVQYQYFMIIMEIQTFRAIPVQKSCSREKSFPDMYTIFSAPITFSHKTVFPILDGSTIYVRYPSIERLCFNRS